MPQNPEKVIDHLQLFRQPEYKEIFAEQAGEFRIRPR